MVDPMAYRDQTAFYWFPFFSGTGQSNALACTSVSVPLGRDTDVPRICALLFCGEKSRAQCTGSRLLAERSNGDLGAE